MSRACACPCRACGACGTGAPCPHDARIRLPSPWREYAIGLGGVAAAAADLGVDRKTYGNWAAGRKVPRALAKREVRRRMREAGIAEELLPYPESPEPPEAAPS